MAPQDRALAERVHATVTASAPELSPKTWYGMPAYANAGGEVVVFFQDAGKFSYRYSTLGFQDAANLDDEDMWPVPYALKKWTPVVDKKVAELVKAAMSWPLPRPPGARAPGTAADGSCPSDLPRALAERDARILTSSPRVRQPVTMGAGGDM